MLKRYPVYCALLFLCFNSSLFAQTAVTKRIEQLDNAKVKVWKTIIYPSKQQTLSMHRHEQDRVVVALTNGTLKIKNDKGKVHYLHLKKGQSYYLTKDTPHELHSDQNVSGHPIEVIVIELKCQTGRQVKTSAHSGH
jgi:mannose-6-phosphate isomerase-like protein (cupin superfamily)